MMKLLDAMGGIALAFLTLTGLALSVGTSVASLGAAREMLLQAEAVGTTLGILDQKAALGLPYPVGIPLGNLTCGVSNGLGGPASMAFSFQTAAGSVRVAVKCDVP